MIKSEEIAERMKREILDDAFDGRVPVQVNGFADLHLYVDANCYGGAEELYEAAHNAVPDTDEAHTHAWNSFCDLVNPAIDAVNAWIKAGGIRTGLAERSRQ